MKQEKPIMMTQTLGTPSMNSTPNAATRMDAAIPRKPPMASLRRPILSM